MSQFGKNGNLTNLSLIKQKATGSRDKTVRILSTTTDQNLHTFTHHRDAISSLTFRKSPQNQLYSASLDRTVKVWNVDEGTYIETLFGHQDHIPSIDSLSKERCLTSGSRDRTVRLWKIVEE
ncbi:pre-rRNA processing protein, partial [Rhizophlyctis rosea]